MLTTVSGTVGGQLRQVSLYLRRMEKCIQILAALMETVHRTIQSAETDGDRHAISTTDAHE